MVVEIDCQVVVNGINGKEDLVVLGHFVADIKRRKNKVSVCLVRFVNRKRNNVNVLAIQTLCSLDSIFFEDGVSNCILASCSANVSCLIVKKKKYIMTCML